MAPEPSPLRRRLADELRAAMKRRDRVRASALRSAVAALGDAEAVDATGSEPGKGAYATEVARRSLTSEEEAAVVAATRDDLARLAAEMDEHGQASAAADLRAQVAALDAVLP